MINIACCSKWGVQLIRRFSSNVRPNWTSVFSDIPPPCKTECWQLRNRQIISLSPKLDSISLICYAFAGDRSVRRRTISNKLIPRLDYYAIFTGRRDCWRFQSVVVHAECLILKFGHSVCVIKVVSRSGKTSLPDGGMQSNSTAHHGTGCTFAVIGWTAREKPLSGGWW